jgi:hypothetical protein
MNLFSLRAWRIYSVDLLLVTAFAVALRLSIDISLALARNLEQTLLENSVHAAAELASDGYVIVASINGDLASRMFLFPLFLGLSTLLLVLRARYAQTAGFDAHRAAYRHWRRHGPTALVTFLLGKAKPAKSILFATVALQGLLYGSAVYFLARSFTRISYFMVNGYSTFEIVHPFAELQRVPVFFALAALILSQCRTSGAHHMPGASASQ